MNLNSNSNSSSLSLIRNLNSSWESIFKSISRLSSGLKINSAADGPAVLVISEQLRSRIATLNQQIENIDYQIYKYQYASSTVSQLRADLTELRTLTVAAANEGGNNTTSQDAYQSSADYIVSNYNYIVETAEYNGSYILDGSLGSLASVGHMEDLALSSVQGVEASIERIDQAIAEIDAIQVDLGARQANSLEPQKSNLEVTKMNLIAAESNLRDVDYFEEFINMILEMIRSKANIALLAHANITSQSVINLLSTR